MTRRIIYCPTYGYWLLVERDSLGWAILAWSWHRETLAGELS
jgi:hypothetical protein